MNTKTVFNDFRGFVARYIFTSTFQSAPSRAQARQAGVRQTLLDLLAFLRDVAHDRAAFPAANSQDAPALVSRVGTLYHVLPTGRQAPAAALLDADRFEVRGG